MEIATLDCFCLVKLNFDKTKIEDIRLAYGVANPTPIRVKQAEDFARGKGIKDTSLFDEIGEKALLDTNPRDSWRASKEFRQQIIKELDVYCLKQSILRAGRKIND